MNNKYYKCKHYSIIKRKYIKNQSVIKNSPPCNKIKYGYCPVIQHNLTWLPISNPDIICSYGIIDVSWTQYIVKKDVIDKEFKSNVYTLILLFVYKIKNYFKYDKRFRATIDF